MVVSTDQLAKLETQIVELSDKICGLQDMGKDAPKGTIRGLQQRLRALVAMTGGSADSLDPKVWR